MKQLTSMVGNVPGDHRKTNFCTCGMCMSASRLGCTHPHKCLETAKKLINSLAPIWRPRDPNLPELGTTSPSTEAREDPNEGKLVDAIRDPTDLKDSIRIFTERKNLLSATVLQTTDDETQATTELVVYTDGSCINNGTDDAIAGSGVWYGPQDTRNLAIRVPGKKQSNQVGELLAIHTCEELGEKRLDKCGTRCTLQMHDRMDPSQNGDDNTAMGQGPRRHRRQ
ncbi:hypothetical protein BJ322DRAFT_1069957 [Thelephora terrestris]|uniref:ribonuclease H n=1 Tax=Thelephora terrestris TaxID=56493 RepID=A0A9P6HB07_9AGAM|nr:hypothetical protein BJ322DRAFT_1069957 [Thelephora terrestris]